MKSFLVNLALASSALAASNVSLPNGWFIIPPAQKISPGDFHGQPRYLTWMADSQIKHGIEPTHAYTVSALLSGVKLAYDRTQEDKYKAYIEKHVGIQLYPANNGNILMYNNSNSIDDIRFGHAFLDMYNITGGEEIYKTAAKILRDQIDRSRRTPDGGFYHRYPDYIDQVRGLIDCCAPSMRQS
jgi:unsaturated rhamnogalacturonyl hydrolase